MEALTRICFDERIARGTMQPWGLRVYENYFLRAASCLESGKEWREEGVSKVESFIVCG